jgi:hypothetical protein
MIYIFSTNSLWNPLMPLTSVGTPWSPIYLMANNTMNLCGMNEDFTFNNSNGKCFKDAGDFETKDGNATDQEHISF